MYKNNISLLIASRYCRTIVQLLFLITSNCTKVHDTGLLPYSLFPFWPRSIFNVCKCKTVKELFLLHGNTFLYTSCRIHLLYHTGKSIDENILISHLRPSNVLCILTTIVNNRQMSNWWAHSLHFFGNHLFIFKFYLTRLTNVLFRYVEL